MGFADRLRISDPLPGEFLRRAFAVVAVPVSFLVLRAFLADFALP